MSDNNKIQCISCNGGKVFAACRVPECYTDAEWMKELRNYVSKKGCTVSVVDTGSFSFDSCECKVSKECKLKIHPTQLALL